MLVPLTQESVVIAVTAPAAVSFHVIASVQALENEDLGVILFLQDGSSVIVLTLLLAQTLRIVTCLYLGMMVS